MKLDKTNRGFYRGEFLDRYDEECSIQESSLASEACIWLGVSRPRPKYLKSQYKQVGMPRPADGDLTGWAEYPLPEGVSLTARMHLTQEHARQLIPMLQHFVDTGELPSE